MFLCGSKSTKLGLAPGPNRSTFIKSKLGAIWCLPNLVFDSAWFDLGLGLCLILPKHNLYIFLVNFSETVFIYVYGPIFCYFYSRPRQTKFISSLAV